jgi:hypothetical protein
VPSPTILDSHTELQVGDLLDNRFVGGDLATPVPEPTGPLPLGLGLLVLLVMLRAAAMRGFLLFVSDKYRSPKGQP